MKIHNMENHVQFFGSLIIFRIDLDVSNGPTRANPFNLSGRAMLTHLVKPLFLAQLKAEVHIEMGQAGARALLVLVLGPKNQPI